MIKIAKNIFKKVYYSYPTTFLKNPIKLFLTLKNCKPLLNYKNWRKYPHFQTTAVFTAPFYWVRLYNILKFGRSGVSPFAGLGNHKLTKYFFYTMLSLKVYCRAGSVTLLCSMFSWWASHFIWSTYPNIDLDLLIIVMVLVLFSSSFYQNTFVYQNYNVVGWMFMPTGLFAWLTSNWELASFIWFCTSFGSMTIVFLAFILSLAFSAKIYSILPALTLIPAIIKTFTHFIPSINSGSFKEDILKIGKAIGFFGNANAKYTRSGVSLDSFIKKRYKSIIIYSQFFFIFYAITNNIPFLFLASIIIWFSNSSFFRFADDESMKMLIFTVASTSLIFANEKNILLLLSYWVLATPYFETYGVLFPINVTTILNSLEKFFEPVGKGKRIIIAFDDPDGDYNKIFDGQRFLIDFPMYIASIKNIHLMPDFSSVFEANYENAPNLWGRNVDELKKQIKYWNADYCIAYQLDSSNLEDKWLAADFIKVSDLSWKSLADKEDLTLPGELYPYWFLLQPLKK